MGSEITGLDDRHAYLKLGNHVARFAFDYLDLPTPTPSFIPRGSADTGMSFDPDTLKPRVQRSEVTPESAEPEEASQAGGSQLAKDNEPIPWPINQAATERVEERKVTPAPLASIDEDLDEEESIEGPAYIRET